jgi:Ala-tRNA(Pro) deacylase
MTISHAVAYTAKETAALTHISNKELAKTVIVKIDRALAMAVLPASYEVDLSSLRTATGARRESLVWSSHTSLLFRAHRTTFILIPRVNEFL